MDRSFEARSTPALTPNRFNSPRSGSGSPFQRQLFKPASTSSLGSLTNRRASPHSPITRELIQERLLRRKSEETLLPATEDPTPFTSPPGPEAASDLSRDTQLDDEVDPAPNPLARGQHLTYDGVMSIDLAPQPIDPPRPALPERSHTVDVIEMEMDAKRAFAGLDLDFEHGFGLGEEGMSVSAGLRPARHSGVHLGDVSALDKLMEDIGHGAGVGVSANTSMLSEGASYASGLHVEAITQGVQAQTLTLPDIVQEGSMRIDIHTDPSISEVEAPFHVPSPADSSPPPPPPPAKQAIRARDDMIKAKRRELRQFEDGLGRAPNFEATRYSQLHDMGANDAGPHSESKSSSGCQRVANTEDENLLGIAALRDRGGPLAETINRELKKREKSTHHVGDLLFYYRCVLRKRHIEVLCARTRRDYLRNRGRCHILPQ